MAIEIERRFLVDVSKLPDLSPCIRNRIVQGYYNTAEGSGVVRVRTVNGTVGFLTTKFRAGHGTNKEFEYQIPVSDADEILSALPFKISKTRFEFPFVLPDQTILKWEIDFFDCGTVIAEVEVPDININFDLPEWLGKEITGRSGTSNFDMAVDMQSALKRIVA